MKIDDLKTFFRMKRGVVWEKKLAKMVEANLIKNDEDTKILVITKKSHDDQEINTDLSNENKDYEIINHIEKLDKIKFGIAELNSWMKYEELVEGINQFNPSVLVLDWSNSRNDDFSRILKKTTPENKYFIF